MQIIFFVPRPLNKCQNWRSKINKAKRTSKNMISVP